MCYNFISYYRLKGGIFLNKKLIVLIGKSNAGKTTLANLIQRELGIKKVVTCTTREKRIGEKDGVDYHFLNKDVALKQVENGEFIEHEIFNDWLYGTRYVDIDLSQNQVIVLNPSGYKTVKSIFKNNVVGVYINPPFHVRLRRIIKRDSNNYREAVRRIFADLKDFSGVENIPNTYIIKGINIEQSLKDIKEILNYE